MVKNSRLPKALELFMGSGKSSFEDDEAVWWEVDLEPDGTLPDSVSEAHPEAQVFANNGVGDLLFLVPQTGTAVLDDKIFVFRHEGHEVQELSQRLGRLLNPGRRDPSDHSVVYYHDFDDAVRLGDRVELKLWLVLRRQGEVVYVPGISPRKPSMERDGLAWVRVRLDNKDWVDVIVNPDTSRLQKGVRKI